MENTELYDLYKCPPPESCKAAFKVEVSIRGAEVNKGGGGGNKLAAPLAFNIALCEKSMTKPAKKFVQVS